jgi:predicted glycosyltransferase
MNRHDFVCPDGNGSRFLFITNECAGLGHLRRNLTLARAVTELEPDSSALVVTGSAALGSFAVPPRVDTVKLPVLHRDADGTLRARSLGVDVRAIESMRSRLLVASAMALDPDVTVIDKTPLGLRGELVPMLERLRREGRSKIVLGLRNIEDDPERVRAAWTESRMLDAIATYYDAVFVYGPPSTTGDALSCLGADEIPVPVHHVGLVGSTPDVSAPDDLPSDYLVVTVGGGSDGCEPIEAVLDANARHPLPLPVIVVTGPLMPSRTVKRLSVRCDEQGIRLFEFRADMPRVIGGARAVVAMAGYNTVAEIQRSGTPALLIPRVRPSTEQLIRASELAATGDVAMLHPDDITPERTRLALDELLRQPRRPTLSPEAEHETYGGARRAAELLSHLAGSTSDRVGAQLAAL